MENIKLLMIEDESKEMEDFLEAFRIARYDVEVAEDGSEAIKLLLTKHYDIVLLDIMVSHGAELPISIPSRRTGIEILRMIRSGNFDPITKKDIPIVVFTALGTSREITDIRKLEADNIIQKPTSPDLLLFEIDDLVKNRLLPDNN